MTRGEWFAYGLEHGFCTDLVCDTHDSVALLTPDEKAEFDDGGDPCVFVTRLLDTVA